MSFFFFIIKLNILFILMFQKMNPNIQHLIFISIGSETLRLRLLDHLGVEPVLEILVKCDYG